MTHVNPPNNEKLFILSVVLYTWSSPPIQISDCEFIPNFKEPPSHLNSQSLICITRENHVYNTTGKMNNFSQLKPILDGNQGRDYGPWNMHLIEGTKQNMRCFHEISVAHQLARMAKEVEDFNVWMEEVPAQLAEPKRIQADKTKLVWLSCIVDIFSYLAKKKKLGYLVFYLKLFLCAACFSYYTFFMPAMKALQSK